MLLCARCYTQGYCRRLYARVVCETQLHDPNYLLDLKAFCRWLNVNDEEWLEFLTGLYRDYPGWISDGAGREVFLDMQEFERPYIREWFRDFCCKPCPPGVQPRVRSEAVERVRILATILTACFPEKAAFWGLRGDNDNNPA